MDFKLEADNALIDALRAASRLLEQRPQRLAFLKTRFSGAGPRARRNMNQWEVEELRDLEDEDVQILEKGHTWESLKREVDSVVEAFRNFREEPRGQATFSLQLMVQDDKPRFEDPLEDPRR